MTDENKKPEYYDQAKKIVIEKQKCSISFVQRGLSIGYNMAAALVERMEEEGVVSASNHVGKREVIVKADGTDQAPKPTPTPPAQPPANSGSDDETEQTQYRVTSSELRAFVERIERLEIERADTAEHIKGVYAESKARGYDTAILRKIIALRKKDPQEISEEEAVLEMYKDALGL